MNAHSLDHRPLPAAGEIVPLFAHDQAAAAEGATRIALIGTFAPRKCGIATFTTDVFEQLGNFHPDIGVDVYALDSADSPIEYRHPRQIIVADDPGSYAKTARAINESGVDAVWVQHEFGIFGGPDGEMVCDFVDHIAPPLIFTFHTVLTEPSPRQRAIVEHLIGRASRIMVMSHQGRDLLVERYGAQAESVDVIPHGAPVRPFGRTEAFKQRLGLHGRRVLMTFGLLGPGKGLERVIEAMPAIIARHPETVYRIVGATHPNLIATQGETYREKLQALARSLGVDGHILWENRFLETEELLDQLEACDIYVTPYVNLQQSTSGTLSYAVALGKAVVSTPYVHARELLAGGVGVLIAPDCHKALAGAICNLLDDEEKLGAMQRRAYEKGHTMVWPEFARASATLIHSAIGPRTRSVPLTALPSLSAVFEMSDATGMLQHAIGIVPDRNHGYCLDDNARALMLMNVALGLDPEERRARSVVYASFVQHAWNPDARRFRNFMHFDRSWCEDIGSEDSNGRTLWALGQTIECAPDRDLQRWAERWFSDVADDLAEMTSPRARAFCTIGAAAALRRLGRHPQAEAILDSGGDLLHRLLDSARRPDWAWFEAVLGYDNPRLSHALIEAGHLRGRQDWIGAGIATLEWIAERQIAAGGHFRPVGSETFGREHAQLPFDQQALEAQAAIEAAQAAYRVTGEARWIEHALAAYGWFFGVNDRRVMLADLSSGRCRDGVTPRGVNENCGAESILAFQLAYYSLTTLCKTGSRQPARGTTLERRIQEFDQSASNL
jgi:glycosyltransferase involved in cell wall biosynthesis